MPHKAPRELDLPTVDEGRRVFGKLRSLLIKTSDPATTELVVKSLWKKVCTYRPSDGRRRLTEHESRLLIGKLKANFEAALEILQSNQLYFQIAPHASGDLPGPVAMRDFLHAALPIVREAELSLRDRPALQRNYFVIHIAEHILETLQKHRLERQFTKVFNLVVPLIGCKGASAASAKRSVARGRAREGRSKPARKAKPAVVTKKTIGLIHDVMHKSRTVGRIKRHPKS